MYIAWFGALLIAACFPVLRALAIQWNGDADMSHGFFVPVVAAYIVWQQRDQILAMRPEPNWWGFALVVWGGLQLWLGVLAAELFVTRTAFVVTLIGAVWLLCGSRILRKLAFPLFLCFFMVPIPAVIYNSITFPLQLLASRLAEHALSILSVPVLREGNVLILPNQELSVVEACSRVTLAGVMTVVKPELAEGVFHTASGWVIFMVALIILIFLHRAIVRVCRLLEGRRGHALSQE
jgi:exosortase